MRSPSGHPPETAPALSANSKLLALPWPRWPTTALNDERGVHGADEATGHRRDRCRRVTGWGPGGYGSPRGSANPARWGHWGRGRVPGDGQLPHGHGYGGAVPGGRRRPTV